MNSCYIGAATEECLYGLRLPEVGYRITGITHDWEDGRVYQNDSEGTPIGFRSGHARRLVVSIDGRICGEDPVDPSALPFTFPCDGVVVVANLISGYGVVTGGLYLETLNITEADEADATFNATVTREPQIA